MSTEHIATLLLTFSQYIVSCTAFPHEKQINVTVPDNAFQHDDPHVVCLPTRWYKFVVFYLVNYVAHAATVKSIPGEQLPSIVFNIVSALFFPYYGISRGLEAVIRGGAFYSDQLIRAAQSGALCTVIRTDTWEPRANQTVKGLSTSETSRSYRLQLSPLVDFEEIDLKSRFWSRQIHGLHFLPPSGYGIAILPSNADVKPKLSNSSLNNLRIIKTGDVTISATYNFAKGLAAAAQIGFAIATLVRTTSGDQIRIFGYAAFGWTVLPYLIMSAVNIAGNLATPDYPTLYLVNSFELEEAAAIANTVNDPLDQTGFDGTVGKLMQYEGTSGTFEKPDLEELVCSFSAQEAATIEQDAYATLKIPACASFHRNGTQRWNSRSSFHVAVFVCYVFGAIPYAVIGSLTHFQKGESTLAERVLTQLWLAMGIIIGAFLSPLCRHDPLSIYFGPDGPLGVPKHTRHPNAWSLVYVVFFYAAPAIGGYAIVGVMLKKYGSCEKYQ